jgi:hypothetical protein
MAKLIVKPASVTVELTGPEAFWGFHKDIEVWAPNVVGAQSLGKGWLRTLGLRVPGTAIPGLVIYGTYKWRGDNAYVSWRRGTQPLQINLTNHKYSRIIVGVPNAAALAEEINNALTGC